MASPRFSSQSSSLARTLGVGVKGSTPPGQGLGAYERHTLRS